MAANKKVIEKARLLALAYVRAKAGDRDGAGDFMVSACEGTEIDPIMHGIAEGLGFNEDDDDDADDVAPALDEAPEDDEAEDASVEDDVELEEVPDMPEESESDDTEDEDVEEDDTISAKISIPASVLKLANIKY